MPTVKAEARDLHFEHNLWENELKFAADELNFFEKRLEVLVKRFDQRNVLAGVEHFQNQFIRQREVLDQLKRDIHVHEQHLGQALQNGMTLDDSFSKVHLQMRERMDMFRKILAELKGEFYHYLTKLI